MNCLFGDNNKNRKAVQYVEIKGPSGANLQPIRNMILQNIRSDNVQVFINRNESPNQVQVFKLRGKNSVKVYEGPGQQENYNDILNYVKSN